MGVRRDAPHRAAAGATVGSTGTRPRGGEPPMTAPQRKPWFRPKTIGRGWSPNSWQGWLIIFVPLVVALVLILLIVLVVLVATRH